MTIFVVGLACSLSAGALPELLGWEKLNEMFIPWLAIAALALLWLAIRNRSMKVKGQMRPGHPEGYIEAFTNLYSSFVDALRVRDEQRELSGIGATVPQIYDGLKGVAFVDAVVDSHEQGTVWGKPKYC